LSKALSYVGTIVGTLANIEKEFQENYDGVNQRDRETQDLLHEIELTKFDVVKGYKLLKKVQVCRQERRKMKDENFQMAILKELIDKNPNIKTLFSQAHSKIQKSLNELEVRVYNPRIREDLTFADAIPLDTKEKLAQIVKDKKEKKEEMSKAKQLNESTANWKTQIKGR